MENNTLHGPRCIRVSGRVNPRYISGRRPQADLYRWDLASLPLPPPRHPLSTDISPPTDGWIFPMRATYCGAKPGSIYLYVWRLIGDETGRKPWKYGMTRSIRGSCATRKKRRGTHPPWLACSRRCYAKSLEVVHAYRGCNTSGFNRTRSQTILTALREGMRL